MKQTLLLLTMVATAHCLLAQKLRTNLYSAYVFDDHVESYATSYDYFEGEISGGYQWGAGLEYFPIQQYSVELLYQRQDTHAPIAWQAGSSAIADFEDFNMDINYILLGSNRYVQKLNGKLETYAGLVLGMAIIDVENKSNRESESITKFSWGGRIGCNIWASEKVAIKIQAQLLSIVQAAGGGAYFGTSGTGVGVSTYSTVYQFGLGGGLAFKMGGQNNQQTNKVQQ